MITGLGILLIVFAYIGCVVPFIPGPVIGYFSLVLLFWTDAPPSLITMILTGAFVVVTLITDYFVPVIGAKRFRCSRWGVWGCFLGTLAGLLFMPIGLIAGPLVGTVWGESLTGRRVEESVESGMGALVGLFASTMIKILCCTWIAIVFLFDCLWK